MLFQCVIGSINKNKFTFYVSCIKEHFSHVWHPSGLPILPNLLCLRTLEVLEYVCVYAASHLRQIWQLQNLGSKLLSHFACARFRVNIFFPATSIVSSFRKIQSN